MTTHTPSELLRDWQSVRSETLELLEALNDKKLAFTPEGKRWQPLSYQFACIGRTQLVYAWALKKGSMSAADFTGKGLPARSDITTRQQLEELLEWADGEWYTALNAGIFQVKMPKETVTLYTHMYRLAGHERLHHGQIISYFTLAEYKLPKDFKANWAL